MDISVRLKGISKEFGKTLVVNQLDMDVYKGEFLTLLGPSGCGKTTTLRIIAGFEQPTSGEVLLDGKEVVHLPPNKRDVNTVFQSYALFPHMSLEENIGYGLKMKGVGKQEISQRVSKVLQMVQMQAFADRKPRQLSGGQQQRIAVARAIVNNPSVLLLDEPLGALDLKLRKQMQLELKHLQQRLGITFIYVTHDQEEALTMSDRIAVMNNGIIEQIDTPHEIYHRPKTRFVADFIGETNMLNGSVVSAPAKDQMDVLVEGISFTFNERVQKYNLDDEVSVCIRPEFVALTNKIPENKPYLSGRITEHVFVGSVLKTIVTLPSGIEIFTAQTTSSHESFQKGEEVYITWDHHKVIVLAS